MAYVGSQVTFSVIFTDPDTALETDPTAIRFHLTEGIDGTALDWTYDAAPVSGTHYPEGMNPVERTAQGRYALEWIIRKPERQTGLWRGSGAVNQTAQTTAFARHAEREV